MLQVGCTSPQRKSGHRMYFLLNGAFLRHLAASLSHRQRIIAHLSLSESALKTREILMIEKYHSHIVCIKYIMTL